MKNKPKIPLIKKVRSWFIQFSVETYAILREWDLSDEQVKAISTRLELFAIALFTQNFFPFFEQAIWNIIISAVSYSMGIWLLLIAFILKGFKK